MHDSALTHEQPTLPDHPARAPLGPDSTFSASPRRLQAKSAGSSVLLTTGLVWHLAFRDLADGIAGWNVWLLLGLTDIRQRYNRSKFGQFWITLSMAIFIGGIGLVYSALFRQPICEYLPYVAVNITVWTLISGTVTDGSSVFTQAAHLMRQGAVPKTMFILRSIVRNLLTFAHNVVVIPIALFATGVPLTLAIVLVLPGLGIVLAALFLMSMILGVLSTRFRDLPQIIANALQLLFFVTPVMWRADQIVAERRLLVLLNPFAALLRIVTEPLQGRVPTTLDYATSLAFVAALALVGLPLFARFRKRIVYWL